MNYLTLHLCYSGSGWQWCLSPPHSNQFFSIVNLVLCMKQRFTISLVWCLILGCTLCQKSCFSNKALSRTVLLTTFVIIFDDIYHCAIIPTGYLVLHQNQITMEQVKTIWLFMRIIIMTISMQSFITAVNISWILKHFIQRPSIKTDLT